MMPVFRIALVRATRKGLTDGPGKLTAITKTLKKKKRAEARFFFLLKVYSSQLLTLTKSSSTSVPAAAFKRSTFSA